MLKLLRGFQGPRRTSSPHITNLLFYHHPDSRTWRWGISASRGRRFRKEDGRWHRGWFAVHGGHREVSVCAGGFTIDLRWQPRSWG